MGEEIRARLRRNAREPYTWLVTAMAVVWYALHATGRTHLALMVLVLEVATVVVDRATFPAARSQRQ